MNLKYRSKIHFGQPVLRAFCLALLLCALYGSAGQAERFGPYYTESDHLAVVNNPDPTDRLHLRMKAFGSAKSLAKYYNGTVVVILRDTKPEDEWAHVQVGEAIGYMQAQYLAQGDAGRQVESAQPVVTVQNTAGTGLNLRRDQTTDSPVIRLLENGTQVTVMGISEEWLHVLAGADTGYIKTTGVTPRLAYQHGVPGGGGAGLALVLADPLPLYTKPLDNLSPAENADALADGYIAKGKIVTVRRVQGNWALVGERWAETRLLKMLNNHSARVIAPCSAYSRPLQLGEAGTDPNSLITGALSPGDAVTVRQVRDGYAQIADGSWVSVQALQWEE